MRWLSILFLTSSGLLIGQGTTQTAPLPNPYGPGVQRAPAQTRPLGRAGVRGRGIGRGGLWIGVGGGVISETRSQVLNPEPRPAPKEDKLKELIISPVYQREKISPRMIEIP